MTTSAQELLKRHAIDFVATKSGKFTTVCPNCNGGGYLNVEIKKDGVVWFCHDCEFGGGDKFEQAPQPKGDGGLGPIKACYDYTDETGKLLFQALRFEPPGQAKQFRQRTGPDQEKWSIKNVRIVPYRLPELLADLAADHVVMIVEGEKDVDTLRKFGVPATTNPMGAGKWWPEFNPIFRGADVVVCGDNDQPGREHVQKVVSNLHGVAARVRVLDLVHFWRDIEPSADISDWLKTHSVELLWNIIADLTDYQPHTPGAVNGSEHPAASKLDILSCAQFLQGFVPPDYLVHGILQRRYIYALTGQTGHAKTAVALLIAQLVACTDRNAMLGTFKVEKGRAIYFAGENPDDLRMRVIGSHSQRTDNPDGDNIWFIPGIWDMDGIKKAVALDCAEHGEVALIIVDTSAAYFLGNDEISNTQMGNYARMLRTLTTLPGGPCVLVLCHPVKHVEEAEKLLPRGGSAYLAEVDGNLTLWKKPDGLVEMSYTKMRGPGFDPITFRLNTIKTEKLQDMHGNWLPTVQAIAIPPQEVDTIEAGAVTDENRVLAAMLVDPEGSLASWATQLDWVMASGDPYKERVKRVVEKLAKTTPRMTKKIRNRWVLTDEGKADARRAAMQFRDEAENKSQGAMF